MEEIVFSDQTLSIIESLKNTLSATYIELTNKFGKPIRDSKKLGTYGWTVDAAKPRNNPSEWLSIIESTGEESIADLFSEDDIELLLCMIEDRYRKLPEQWYVFRATENYRSGHYTEAALFLIAVLDHRISCISPEEYKKKVEQCTYGLLKIERGDFEKNKQTPMHRTFSISLYFPSFSSFATRLFVDGEYRFENGVEPPYLNRNWLFHGKMTRSVRRYECIQLLQAFSTLKEIEDYSLENT